MVVVLTPLRLRHSLILNPSSPHYPLLRSTILRPSANIPTDEIYFLTEALVMEYNSRDYVPRMRISNRRAAVLVGFLRGRMRGDGGDGVLKQVMYPDSQTAKNFEMCRRQSPLPSSALVTPLPADAPSALTSPTTQGQGQVEVEPGYGPLLSLLFHTPTQARVFYDALRSPKGTSFGTPFSMTLPYVCVWGEFAQGRVRGER